MAAGLLTGGLYRISHGPKNSAIGAAVGLVSALALELLRKDYDRIDEMISKTRTMFKT
jgi:hypothetical protein